MPIWILLCFLAAAPGEPPSPGPPEPVTELISSRSPRWWSSARKTAVAVELQRRVTIEAKRRDLPAAALLAIAWIESRFDPGARNARDGSVGLFQLMVGDAFVLEAAPRLAGCRPPPGLRSWLRPWWLRRGAGKGCEDQSVADARSWYGHFRAEELRDVRISTYVAAYEIARHRESARRSGLRIRSPPSECAGLPQDLLLLAKFNSGPRPPRTWYLRQLCHRYRLISRILTSA